MSLSTPENLQKFEQIIHPWMVAYRFADCASVVMKFGDQSTLLFGRILLRAYPQENPQSFQLDTEHLSVRRALMPILEGGASQLITSAGTGTLTIHDARFSLKQEGEYLGSSLLPLRHPEVVSNIRVPTLRIYGTGQDDSPIF